MTIIAVAIVLAFFMGYLAFKPVNVLRPSLQPYKVLTHYVTPGQLLIYEVDACKYKDIQGSILRRFVDKNNLVYPVASSQGNVPPGCHDTKVSLLVPSELHAGDWYLSLDVSYQVNPLRHESYHLRTETFTIIK